LLGRGLVRKGSTLGEKKKKKKKKKKESILRDSPAVPCYAGRPPKYGCTADICVDKNIREKPSAAL